jgi:hypothetical protein
MERENLLEKIDKGIKIEEGAVPIYTDYLQKIELSDKISERKKVELRENLELLKKDSQRHEKMLRKIEDKILESDRDDF